MKQDNGNLGNIENDYRFVEGLAISMSNSTPPGKEMVFNADAWVYSETEIKDSQRLTKGWQLVKLFGNGIWVE